MNISITIGLDLAKRIFHFVVLDENRKKIGSYKVSREELVSKLREIAPAKTLISMEGCSGSNYWGESLDFQWFFRKITQNIRCESLCKNTPEK